MNILEILKVIIIGIVEGITEWLPISSTGHIVFIEQLFNFNVSENFKDMFDVVIQLGAILAVAVVYFKKLNPFNKGRNKKKMYLTVELWKKIIVACLPAAMLGLLINHWVKEHLLNGFVISMALIIYGILFIMIENSNKNRAYSIKSVYSINYQTALFIGFFQVLALIPGTSRSGATIIGAMILGVSRSVSVEFSFFLSIPIMFGASLLKLVNFGLHYTMAEIVYLLLGMTVAFFVSVFSIGFLLNWIKKNNFKFFGYYRIVFGLIILVWYFTSSLPK
ncbi:undecaprenyl-diphosphatase UppP [Lachnoanaerobaculum saburreum F0468]|jgi:undecaprenyl-diphosphatase uppP|uniref:Undecaprenyl-diphosphatase n=1 Tax=Lachnoanaerobaculum saburreum F0468 TaxID=1095750 RepID=I0RBL1_9FIRM|nr:undecaprenyl-diphosphate phosphatase [Lachnoanaerobaculum saburreum]EIC97069.1 undecaprenyl-diphosphatase UppP [Lachnoanaerobaculum saburreum F0468]